MGESLQWGRHYVAVRPDHFRVDYVINPFMDTADQPDPRRTLDQWEALVATLRDLGARVDVMDQRPDAPDMVYAMNLGLAVRRPAPEHAPEDPGAPHLVLSHMRHPERRPETGTAASWFAARGWTTSYVGRDAVGAHLEAGDAFAFRDALVVGYGPRTEELALKHLAGDLGVRVRGVRISHPGMYHLDLAFAPLDDRSAMVCPAAFDDTSAEELLRLVPDPLVLTEEEALTTFVANSVVVGRTVVTPAGVPERVRDWLTSRDFAVVEVDVSELHKGGGSIRCLTNPVDVTLGRDLPLVPGGEVLLPR